MKRAPSQPYHMATEVKAIIAASGEPELATRFGFSEVMLDDPDAMISLPLLHDFFEAAAEASGDDYFGLHFGHALGRSELAQRFGAVGLLLLVSPDIGTGLKNLIRYHQRLGEGDQSEFSQEGPHTSLLLTTFGESRLATVHIAEKTVAQMLSIFRLVDPPLEPVAVHLAHPRREGDAEVTRVFGIEPIYDSARTAVVVETAHLTRPIKGADPDVFRYLERSFRDGPESAPSVIEDAEFTHLTQVAIENGLPNGECSSEWVAGRLGCSLRTLQRRLASENTSVSVILVATRKIRAKALLGTDMAIGDIAFLLGYSTTGPFVRAFKRWFGVSPDAWRERRTSAGSPKH